MTRVAINGFGRVGRAALRSAYRSNADIEWAEAVVDPECGAGATLAKPEPIASGMARYQWHVAEQLALALDGGRASLCSGAEALTTLQSIQSIIAMRDDQ